MSEVGSNGRMLGLRCGLRPVAAIAAARGRLGGQPRRATTTVPGRHGWYGFAPPAALAAAGGGGIDFNRQRDRPCPSRHGGRWPAWPWSNAGCSCAACVWTRLFFTHFSRADEGKPEAYALKYVHDGHRVLALAEVLTNDVKRVGVETWVFCRPLGRILAALGFRGLPGIVWVDESAG